MKYIVQNDKSEQFSIIKTVLARLLAATPHSADVERSISASNLLKTRNRSRIKMETENHYLFIYFNLSPFTKWNSEKAAVRWLTMKQRRTHNLLIQNENHKSKNRSYFKAVFPQASDSDSESDEGEAQEKGKHASKKRCF